MLFFPSKSSLAEAGVLNGLVDWHSHILPGVDDGVVSMEESLRILTFYEEAGVRTVWLTPHVMEDIPNSTLGLKDSFESLKSEWKGKVELCLASENMLDALFEERLKADDLLPIGKEGKHLLVETSYYTAPYGLEHRLDAIRNKGYTAILAHPERYAYMNEPDYDKLKSQGVLFQLNLMSVIGMYGPVARKKADWLIKKGYVDLLGSDIHRFKHLEEGLLRKAVTKKTIDILLQIKNRKK